MPRGLQVIFEAVAQFVREMKAGGPARKGASQQEALTGSQAAQPAASTSQPSAASPAQVIVASAIWLQPAHNCFAAEPSAAGLLPAHASHSSQPVQVNLTSLSAVHSPLMGTLGAQVVLAIVGRAE